MHAIVNRLFNYLPLKCICVLGSALMLQSCYRDDKTMLFEKKANYAIQALTESVRLAKTDIEKTDLIRAFCAKELPIGNSYDYEDRYYCCHTPDTGIGLVKLLGALYSKPTSVKCGFTARFQLALLRKCGFTAETYNMGVKGTKYTHVTNLVSVLDNSMRKTIVQDAYFNYTIIWADSSRIHFGTLKEHIKAGKTDSVIILQDTCNVREVIRNTYQSKRKYTYQERVRVRSLNNMLLNGTNSFRDSLYSRMKSIGLNPNFLNMYIMPVHARDSLVLQSGTLH